MMELDINNLPKDLHIVNELVTKYLMEGSLSFDEKLRLMYFFKDYGDIGTLFEQEEVNLSTVFYLPISESAAKQIFSEAQAFLDLYKDNKKVLNGFEVKTDCDKYLAPFIHNWEINRDYSLKVHQEYVDLDNRLGYMDEREPDYANLLKKCYELYDQQKEASIRAKGAGEELETARRKLYGLEKFNLKWLYIAVEQISEIIEGVLSESNEEESV